MFEDHAVEEGADDAFLLGVEEGDGLKLKLEVVVRAALLTADFTKSYRSRDRFTFIVVSEGMRDS